MPESVATACPWPVLKGLETRGGAIGTAIFLVSVPVLFQAPLVRALPWVSLELTVVWILIGYQLLQRPAQRRWGDLLIGFSWCWLAGSLYWGWLRQEPLWHLPVEAIAVPLALYCLRQRRLRIGACFYLGSLFGTAMTDLYFYLIDVIPYWREIMAVDVAQATPILREAFSHAQTIWGVSAALTCAGLLLWIGLATRRHTAVESWVFSGAVLGTLLVDSLFGLAAFL